MSDTTPDAGTTLPAQPQTAAPSAPAITPQTDESGPIDINHFAQVQLRTGRVVFAEPVPKSKKLLRLEVDCGALGKRQIVSGIAQFYTPETITGKRVIIVANLKPAMLMGVESQGMLLAAASDDGATLAIVEPHESIVEGSTVR